MYILVYRIENETGVSDVNFDKDSMMQLLGIKTTSDLIMAASGCLLRFIDY